MQMAMNSITAKQVVRFLKKKFGNRCKAETFLFDGTSYRPDLVLRSKRNNRIKAIIEIEQCSRKHVVGGIITADYCMRNRGEKPIMCVLSLRDENTEDYQKRIKMLKQYIKYLKDIFIGDKDEVAKALARIKG